MNRLAEIEARQAEITAELVALRDLAEPTPEDLTRTDTLLDEKDALTTEAAPLAQRAERLAAVEAAVTRGTSTERAFNTPNVIVKKDPFENVEQVLRSASAGEVRDVALRAYDDGRVRGLRDSEQERLVELIETVPGAAAHALVHGTPAYRSAFMKFMDAQGINPRYTDEEFDAIRTALNITTGSSGQFSLPTVFDPTLIHTGDASINPIRQIARVETGTQNVWNGVSSGNVTTYWHAESAAVTDGAPTLAHPIVTAGHLTAYVPASWEFFDDSPMVAQLPGLIAEAFAFKESTAFVTGTGTSQPLGVVTAISATAGSTVTATTRGASSFTSASSADVFAVANALPSRYEARARWIGHKKTFNIVRQMSAAGYGSLFWGNLSDSVTPGQPYPLLGYPTHNSSDVVSTQTTGTVILVLGDFSQYLIYDRLGTQVEFIQNVVDGSGIPLGQRALIARKRVGGNVTDINAFRFLLN